MPIASAAIGTRQDVEVDISTRWVLAYSAAMGFTGPECLDDTRGPDLVVPPTFCVCLEWATMGLSARRSRLGLTPDEVRRGVHVLQDSRFLKPIPPDGRVTMTAEVAYMRNTSAGGFVLSRIDTQDHATGDVLVRSWVGSMIRGVAVDVAQAGEAPADVLESPGALPAEAPAESIAIERTQPHVYTECARIWNPIHTERAVALAAGLPDIIVHGTATWALAARTVLARHAQGDVTRLRRLVSRFRAPIVPGSTISVRHARAPQKPGVLFGVTNAQGEVSLNDGYAELAPAAGRAASARAAATVA